MAKQIDNRIITAVLRRVPFSLTTARLVIAPVILALAYLNAPRFIFVFLIVISFLTDWLDGVIARRLGIATLFLRRYDIIADLSVYVAIFLSACLLELKTVIAYRNQFIVLILLEILCQIFHWARFRSFTATHSYLCKLWAVFLAAAAINVLGLGIAGPFLQIMFITGYIAYADVLLIIFYADRAPVDVISAYHVWLSAEKNKETA